MLPGDAERFRLSGWMEAVDAGVIEAAARAGLNALTLHPDGLDAEGVRRLIADPPLGVLVAHAVGENPWGPPILDRLHRGGVNLVVNGDAPELAAYDRVISDHESGAYELTRWLIRRGRRRILRVWTARLDDYWVRARFAGYERAARESGVAALKPVLVRQFPTGEDADGEIFEARTRQLAGYLLEHLRRPEPVDAIMLASDPDVFPAAAALELLGARPDVDVDVVGYDNNWADCPGRRHYRAAPLATVDKLNHLTGERMLRLLLDDRNGMSGGAEPLRVMVTPRLVVPGESGAVGDGAEREPAGGTRHADVARPAGE
jgi:DNA-binding LacI/PurR family transcriptional regulator